MIYKALLTALLTAPLAAFAQSGTVSGTYIGCMTGSQLKQINKAIRENDARMIKSLYGSACIIVKGLDFTVVDSGILTTTARFYGNGGSVDLIVPSEAVR